MTIAETRLFERRWRRLSNLPAGIDDSVHDPVGRCVTGRQNVKWFANP